MNVKSLHENARQCPHDKADYKASSRRGIGNDHHATRNVVRSPQDCLAPSADDAPSDWPCITLLNGLEAGSRP
jgi:hypothetical protein